ncbi:hypothetical protein A3744_16415 [Oleiphilus sp. HI0073]|nr:hypothetical protein A3744_16415 [Oleiphilus sp. HI0073]
MAEPNALIGFAGPRVIEQTVREKLPEGFQRSEFLLEHGAIDMIVHRASMRSKIVSLLSKLLIKEQVIATSLAESPEREANSHSSDEAADLKEE